MNTEIAAKHRRVAEYLGRSGLNGLVLSSRSNFSWLTGGKLNFVNGAADAGVGALVVTREKIVCVSTNIEESRLGEEELKGTGIEQVSFPWQTGSRRSEIFSQIIGSGPAGFDVAVPGLPKGARNVAGDVVKLRWSLAPEEIERYRRGGRAASKAMENAIRRIKPGMSETEIAGLAAGEVWSQSARPWVILIAADERIKRYRHPIPTDNKLKKTVEVVLCVERYGLISSLTRLVSFGPVDVDLRKRHEAVVKVDAAVHRGSRPGKTLGDMFDLIVRTYEQAGYGGEWQKHHQGGPTGYQSRDAVATPGDTTPLVANQALAWNPSITGTKSEDTIILSDGGPIVVTAAGKEWPMIDVDGYGRPDILVVE